MSLAGKRFTVDVESTRLALLAQEDTTANGQITVDDDGPKSFFLDGEEITGTYQLANLLQELSLAQREGHKTTSIAGAMICENPVDRLLRRIPTFWPVLQRRLDKNQIAKVLLDNKAGSAGHRRIYIPHALPDQYQYYEDLRDGSPELRLEVELLPADLTTSAIFDRLMSRPGLLALGLRDGQGLQYIVPGGRFNEMYYWDSHFAAMGLLESGHTDLVVDIIDNMRFQIEHYGCVLNANRSYYLNRSQPPFLTDLVRRIFEKTGDMDLLKRGILSAIEEYHNVWMSEPRLTSIGLSRYHPIGRGIPPEVERGHYDWYLKSHADFNGISIEELYQQYGDGRLESPELDNFFRHDRAMRESGHDTSRRMNNQAADLACIDLSALLYKYETDIAWALEMLGMPDKIWQERAAVRRQLSTKYLWNEATGVFHDFNIETLEQTPFISATTFYALWSGLATPAQADRMVRDGLPRLEHGGGIVTTLCPKEESQLGSGVHTCQWDAPYGWAPHQMMLWDGLKRYSFSPERLVYKWMHLLTKTAADHNGRITERYDVTSLTKTRESDGAEYGNQGCDFMGVNTEGFGWTNASYLYGWHFLSDEKRQALRRGEEWS